MPEIRLKSNELIYLAEEILRRPNTGFVMWLLAISNRQVCNGKEQVEQKEMQKYGFRRKIAPGNLTLKPRLVLKEMRKLKRGLILNGIKGGEPSGQDPIQQSF